MKRTVNHALLDDAKSNKNDEFYTQLADIERELQHYAWHEDEYPKFDNYDGINVDRTKDIPMDYQGAMGVPITFLHKFNPQQFEIIRFRKGDDDRDLRISGKPPYFRILVRNKAYA